MTPPNASHRKRWEFVANIAAQILEEIEEPTVEDETASLRVYVRNRALALQRVAESAIIDFPEDDL